MSTGGNRWLRLGGVAVGVVAALVIAVTVWYQAVPTLDDLKAEAGLKGKAELVIGVKVDMPGIGLYDPETKTYSGFDVDIAYLIAADLGFQSDEVRFLEIQNEDRSRMRGVTGERVDLVIATYSATPEREAGRQVSFSDPYLETEQSVVTRKDHGPVLALSGLAGERVCTLSTSTSEGPLPKAGAKVVYEDTIAACIAKLRSGELDAVTTDAVILGGFVEKYPDELRHHDIGLETPELWAVNTGGNEALRKLVNISLYNSRNDPADKRWENAFDKHLRPMQKASPNQPNPIDEQPEVAEVEVRRWPWERLSGLVLPVR
ncbi:transporter substrate-binding domain-containing protein [Actinokineospora auranticolor]|uniref:Glutamate transport system substrate-binding protein n=1 Tax=Actinokineospora auranticolor TaxID=155976 RepID=A0A2S6GQF5_9PSEU|nr:transporter substrate-binding domain-containing protein [Actinokineospora auranticolor]PPK67436.1 glutamate transport system substrate-binding protein [Actinokineospora auranticolor]